MATSPKNSTSPSTLNDSSAVEISPGRAAWVQSSKDVSEWIDGLSPEGSTAFDTGWVNITPAGPGWTAHGGHTPRAVRIGNIVFIEGALTRTSTTGQLANLGQMPAGMFRTDKTEFMGAFVASGGVYFGELYVSNTGQITISGYTNLGTNLAQIPLKSFLVLR